MTWDWKMVVRVPNRGSVRFLNLIIHYVNGDIFGTEMKWNESGFRPPLCTSRLNWARRTSWGWWDDWDDTVLQTQDSKFEPWRSEAEHATSRSRRLPTILTFTRGWGRNIFSFFQTAETGNRTPNSGVRGSGANHYPRAPALFGTEERWSVFRDGPRCEASDTGSPLYKQLNCLVHLDTFVFMLLHKTTDIVIQIIWTPQA